jgi:membrane protease YdiL (CAAX protease family)
VLPHRDDVPEIPGVPQPTEALAAPRDEAAVPPRGIPPVRAAFEVLLCSDYPTQVAIAAVLGELGISAVDAAGRLSARFVYLISTIDTVVLLTLIWALLRASGDRPRDVFLQRGRPRHEFAVGLMLVPLAFGVVILLQVGIYLVAPFLRNVPQNPFHSLLGSPLEIAAFVLLVLVAGGVREEIQRAFLLRRFEQSLGGPIVGLVVTSLAFGLGHTLQGWDAAVVTGLLGALWGLTYLRRRNVISTVVSHALFNVGEIVMAFWAVPATLSLF